MSGLSQCEEDALIRSCDSDPFEAHVAHVEALIARHVAAALNDAAESLLAETHADAHREVCEQQYRSDRTSAHVALDVAAAWLRARAT